MLNSLLLPTKILDLALAKNPANLDELKALPMENAKVGDKGY